MNKNNTECTNSLCLDNPSKTKISMGNKILSLAEFEDMVTDSDRVKEKMKMIDNELEKY